MYFKLELNVSVRKYLLLIFIIISESILITKNNYMKDTKFTEKFRDFVILILVCYQGENICVQLYYTFANDNE